MILLFIFFFSFFCPSRVEENSREECILKGGGVFGQCGSPLAPCKWPRWGGIGAHAPLDSPLSSPTPLRPLFPSRLTLSSPVGQSGDVMRTSAVASRFLIAENAPRHCCSPFFPFSRFPKIQLPFFSRFGVKIRRFFFSALSPPFFSLLALRCVSKIRINFRYFRFFFHRSLEPCLCRNLHCVWGFICF